MVRRILPILLAALLFGHPLFFPNTTVYAAPAQQESVATYAGIVNANANIRSGPGLEFPVVGRAEAGQAVNAVGCNEDCSWLKLDTGNWIATFLVNLLDESGDTDDGGSGNGLINPDDLVIGEPSQAALDMVQEIMSYTGLPQTFTVYSANIYNAGAVIVDGQRVILYDPELIADMENATQNRWSVISILAHEIGHHLAGHTLADDYIQEYELEADYFSGFILYKMRATLQEAQSAMSLLRDHPNLTTHPAQAERLAAIEEGWRAAASQEGVAMLPLPNGSVDVISHLSSCGELNLALMPAPCAAAW